MNQLFFELESWGIFFIGMKIMSGYVSLIVIE